MTGFILHFGQQNGFTPQGWCASDPVTFRQHTNNLGVRMLPNLADQCLSVSIGHSVLWLDSRFLGYPLLKAFFLGHVITFTIPVFVN